MMRLRVAAVTLTSHKETVGPHDADIVVPFASIVIRALVCNDVREEQPVSGLRGW